MMSAATEADPRPAISVVVPFAGDREAAETALAALRSMRLCRRRRADRGRQQPARGARRGRSARGGPGRAGGRAALLLLRAQSRRRGGEQRVAAVPRRRLPPGAGPARAVLRRSGLRHGRRDRRADRRERPGRAACRALGGRAGERRPGATPARVQRRRRRRQPARPQADVARRRRLPGRDPVGWRSRPLLARGRARLDGRAPARPERRASTAATASGPGRADRPLGRRQRLAGAPQSGHLAGAARVARGGLRAAAGGATCGPPALGGRRPSLRSTRSSPPPVARAPRRQRGSPRAARASDARSVAVFVESFPARSETFVVTEARALAARGWRVRSRPPNGPTARSPAAGAMAGRLPRGRGPAHPRRRWPGWSAPGRSPAPATASRAGAGAAEELMPLRGLAPLALRLRQRRRRSRPRALRRAGGDPRAARRPPGGLHGSVAAHAYDIYAEPQGLAAKLEAADFVTADCEYTAATCARCCPRPRRAGPPRDHGGRCGAFAAARPYPGGRTVPPSAATWRRRASPPGRGRGAAARARRRARS